MTNKRTFFTKAPSTKFVVKNIAPNNKTVRIFNVPIRNGATYDLLSIPEISESDIRHSLLKGELLPKFRNGEIIVEESDIDLLQFNDEHKEFLESIGLSTGLEASGAGGGNGSVSDDIPLNISVGSADAGVDGYASRSDHKHSIDTATAISTGATNAEGSSTSLARADHTHAVTDLNIASQEQGSVLYFNGSNWVELPPSTDGNVLTTHDTGANPTWESPSGGVSDHGALSGLTDDDHTQYLLVSGTRAMTGALNMGANNITNVGTVDGVDVSGHASRHLPSGADALTTASPVNVTKSANAEGTANSFARSDHKHDISTAIAVSIGNTNAEGSSTSLSRADHTHEVTDLSIANQEQGSILYFDGSSWVELSPGEDGYVLTTNGTGSDPTWEQVSGGGGGTSNHGLLSGLGDDDHPQYLLVDGTRAMTGALDMGTNNVTNVGTVDGVDISAHASRHLPGGADALTTASAGAIVIGDSASEGSNASFARSDHTHSVAAAVPVNVTKAANAEGVATTFARSDHKHDVSTTTAISIGASNAEGSSTSLSRADHTHAVTDLLITNQEQGSVLYFDGTNWAQLEPGTDGYVLTTHDTGSNPSWDAPTGGGGGSDLATTPPEDVDTDAAETGVSIRAARADHKHDVATATAVSVGAINAEGSSVSLARADHTHAVTDLSITNQEQGSVLYFDGTNWVELSPGSDGYVLTTNGTGADPTWEEAAAGGVTDHGSLSGLTDDDHTQYLLVDGTRAMTGALDMGINNITNVGTVDGVDISAHASRHLPGGADALTTAAAGAIAVGDSATEGSNASFARSDHTHSVSASAPVNVTKAANAEGVAATFARSDHKHDVSTAIAVSVGAVNAEGSSTSLARADHSHEVTDLVIASQEQGSVLYFDGTNWVELPPGSDGYVLTTHDTGADPTWEQVSGGGGGTSNHGLLTGLGDDDHPQYLLIDGSRAMTGNLDIGSNAVDNVSYVDLTTSAAPAYTEGRVFYDDEEKTLAVYNDSSEITHQLGQELLIRVHNGSGSIILDGYAVYEAFGGVNEGAGGARPSVDLAQANTFNTSRLIGVSTEEIPIDGYGFVTNRGIVNGIDLSNFSDGDLVYLSESEAGQFRNGPPPIGNYNALIGTAIDASEGRLLVLTEISLASQVGASSQASTGLINGGALSINSGDSATFDITTGYGEIVDAFTIPGNVNVTAVSWTNQVGLSITNLATTSFTWIGFDTNSNVVQISDRAPTEIEARTTVWLGKFDHPNNDVIISAINEPFGAIQPAQTGADLSRALGPFNIEGNVYSANGVNLNLDKSAGSAYLYGSGFQTDSRNPNTANLLIDTGLTFSYRYRDGSGNWTAVTGQTSIDPGNYDDGTGTLASVTPGSNRWTIQRVQLSTNGETIIYYGQVVYTSQAAAEAAIEDSVVVDPALSETIIRAWIIVRGNTTNLSASHNTILSATNGPGSAQVAGTTGITDHSLLSGLTDDDHTQYLLVDGTRAMSGALNMGSQNITSVGTVDGVDVSAHASRHLPGGADALTTASAGAVAIDDLAGEGSNASFARSDHTHSVTAAVPVNVTKAANSEGVATTFARSDHKHDVETAIAVSVGATNAEGSSTSLARADHIHAVTDLNIASQEQGSVLYFDGTNWVELPPATDGYVLVTHDTGADPTWEGGFIKADGSVTYISPQSMDNNDITDAKTISFESEFDNGNSGTSLTIDWNDGQKSAVTLTGNCTFTFTNPPGPCNLLLKLTQDATGTRTVTWPGTVLWPSGITPTLSTTASSVDIVSLYFDGTNYYSVTSLDFS